MGWSLACWEAESWEEVCMRTLHWGDEEMYKENWRREGDGCLHATAERDGPLRTGQQVGASLAKSRPGRSHANQTKPDHLQAVCRLFILALD